MVYEENGFEGCPKFGQYKKLHKSDVMGPDTFLFPMRNKVCIHTFGVMG